MASTSKAVTKATKQLQTQLLQVAKSWEVDPVRPHLQVSTFLESLSRHPKITPKAVEAAKSLQSNSVSKKHPLSAKLMIPASFPGHYDRIARDWETALARKDKPWWKTMFRFW